jgi:hypothetical protein
MNKDILCGLMFLSLAIVVLGFVAWGVVAYFKHGNVFKNRSIILNAIFLYKNKSIRFYDEFGEEVEFADMETYDKTYKRFWDWGYKRILPPDKYEIIKPYTKEAIEIYKKEK